MKPLCIDLFCGLGGWTEGFLAEGYEVVGFDLERHRYPARELPASHAKGGGGIDFARHDSFNGTNERRLREAPLTAGWAEYPAQLVLQDVLTLHGSQFRDATVIVGSPPCQAYSYMAMPWSRAKREMRWQMWNQASPFSPDGFHLNDLFDACFRIQREASQAAGCHIPLVVENVKGAQRWVGPAKAHFGSFYLWGDVESVGGRIVASGRPEFGAPSVKAAARAAQKANPEGTAHPVNATKGFVSGLGMGHDWRQDPSARFNSKSDSRKAASAMIAKIPFPLAQFIARSFKPEVRRAIA